MSIVLAASVASQLLAFAVGLVLLVGVFLLLVHLADRLGLPEQKAVAVVVGLEEIHYFSEGPPPPGETRGPTLIGVRSVVLELSGGQLVEWEDDIPTFLRQGSRVHCTYVVGRFSGRFIAVAVEYPSPEARSHTASLS